MTPVDRAFAIEQNKKQAKLDALKVKARRELPTLEIEVQEIRAKAVELWTAICSAEGLSPGDVKAQERLYTSDENENLASKYLIVAQLFTAKLAKYRVYCDLLGITPNLKERGSQNNERRKSDVGEGEGCSPATQLRQSRPNHGRRVPRAHPARNNKRK
jgi:hypothetical protein